MFKLFKSPERLFHISMWLVSFVFAGFLIGLGGKLIADLPKTGRYIPIEEFANKDVIKNSRETIERGDESLRKLQLVRQEAQAQMENQRNAYQNAQSANRNWLATRSVTSNNPNALQNDPELLRQTQELGRLSAALREAQVKLESIDSEIRSTQRATENARVTQTRELDRVRPEFLAASGLRELKVFGLRLALTLPLLVISAWLIIKKRKSSHWPLARGFVIFAGFAFFFELVPYLPSYGGYVRYGVGIVLSLIAGHYGIRWMQRYMVRRQEEARRTEADRRAAMDSVQAIQKIAANVCPGCERQIPGALDGVKVNNCVYCGLKLFDTCKARLADSDAVCGVRKNAFFPHCPSCGHHALGSDNA